MEKPKDERPLGEHSAADEQGAREALKDQMAKDLAKDAKEAQPDEAKPEVTCAICGEPGVEGTEHPATDAHGIHDVVAAKDGAASEPKAEPKGKGKKA